MPQVNVKTHGALIAGQAHRLRDITFNQRVSSAPVARAQSRERGPPHGSLNGRARSLYQSI